MSVPDWQFIEKNTTGWIVRRGDLTYRIAPNGNVYVQYYRRHERSKGGSHGTMRERKLPGGTTMAICARHAAHNLGKEAA